MNKCINCQNDTINPKFCSRSCAAITNGKLFPKRKLTRTCTKCDNIVKHYRTRYCDYHHTEYINSRSKITQKHTLNHYWSKKCLSNLHASSKNAHIRALGRYKFKELLKSPCFKCGYDKHVELCHIKPIKDFPETATISEVNSETNVVQLCPNCHWEFDKGLLKL